MCYVWTSAKCATFVWFCFPLDILCFSFGEVYTAIVRCRFVSDENTKQNNPIRHSFDWGIQNTCVSIQVNLLNTAWTFRPFFWRRATSSIASCLLAFSIYSIFGVTYNYHCSYAAIASNRWVNPCTNVPSTTWKRFVQINNMDNQYPTETPG